MPSPSLIAKCVSAPTDGAALLLRRPTNRLAPALGMDRLGRKDDVRVLRADKLKGFVSGRGENKLTSPGVVKTIAIAYVPAEFVAASWLVQKIRMPVFTVTPGFAGGTVDDR